MTDRPYRKFGRPKLQAIAKEKWDSPYELNKIAHELSHRDSSVDRNDVQKLYVEVLSRSKELECMAITQPEDQKLRLRLQEIDELRIQADGSGYFKWPITSAPKGERDLDASDWPENGLFLCVGYHAGNDGEHPKIRRYILDCIFHNKLPSVNSDEYMSKFATPKSPQRLRKMANVLASQTTKLKHRTDADCSRAIEDYESDLEYLYDKYYVGEFNFDQHPLNAGHFGWPDA